MSVQGVVDRGLYTPLHQMATVVVSTHPTGIHNLLVYENNFSQLLKVFLYPYSVPVLKMFCFLSFVKITVYLWK